MKQAPENRPDRSKAEFRALCDLTGYTWDTLAAELDVQPRSVKRWGARDDRAFAPQDAWNVIESALAIQRKVVSVSLDHIEETCSEGAVVELPYYVGEGDFNRRRGELRFGSTWQLSNATARAIYAAASALGYTVEWVGGEENDQES